MNNVAARYQTTYAASVQEEAVVTNIMICSAPEESSSSSIYRTRPFVKELPPSDAEIIGAAGEYVEYTPEHDVLFNEGDDADAMYFVVTGRNSNLYHARQRSAEQELVRLGPLSSLWRTGPTEYQRRQTNRQRRALPATKRVLSESRATSSRTRLRIRANSLPSSKKSAPSNRRSSEKIVKSIAASAKPDQVSLLRHRAGTLAFSDKFSSVLIGC